MRSSMSSDATGVVATARNTGGSERLSEKKTAPPIAHAAVGTNSCETGCTEVASVAARIGPKMNTISSIADSSA